MNTADWIAASGHPIVGRGHRPINPKLAHLLGKAAPPASRRSSSSSGAAARRLAYEIARLTGPTGLTISKYNTRAKRMQAYLAILRRIAASDRRAARSAPVRDPTILEQSQVGAAGLAAIDQHTRAVLQSGRVYGSSSSRSSPTPKPARRYSPPGLIL